MWRTCMRLVLLHGGVVDQSDVVMHVKGEEWAALSTGLDDDEVIEGVGLRDDEVLLHVHQLVGGDCEYDIVRIYESYS